MNNLSINCEEKTDEISNYFIDLLSVDASSHVAKKGEYDYLSWPYAVSELCKRHPKATWTVKRFPMAEHPHVLVPYMETPQGFFVEVEVTVEDVSRTQIHPVLDHVNKPIPMPTNFQLNTSLQRCLVKAIGLHGLGLNLYAGEDVPLGVDIFTESDKEEFDRFIRDDEAYQIYLMSRRLAPPMWIGLYNSFQKDKTKNKSKVDTLVKTGFDMFSETLIALREATDNQDQDGIIEIVEPLTDKFEKGMYWAELSPVHKENIRHALETQEET